MKTTIMAAAIGALLAGPVLAQGVERGAGGDGINGRAGAATGSGSMGGATPRPDTARGTDGSRGSGVTGSGNQGRETTGSSSSGASGSAAGAGSSGAGAGTQGSMLPNNIQTRGQTGRN
jgi:hypothetical protein